MIVAAVLAMPCAIRPKPLRTLAVHAGQYLHVRPWYIS